MDEGMHVGGVEIVVEWLCNLEQLVGKGEFYFQAIPLKFAKGSGSPVRAFAILEE